LTVWIAFVANKSDQIGLVLEVTMRVAVLMIGVLVKMK